MLENSLDKKDVNQTAVLELEFALKNAENEKNTSLIKDLLLKLSSTYEIISDFEKAFFNLKKYESIKNDSEENQYKIDQVEIQLKSEVDSIKQVIEEKNKELNLLSIVARETENSILIMDPNGLIVWVNNSFEKLNGLTITEFKAKYGNTIYEVSNNPEIKNIIQNCIASKKSVSYESPNMFADGKVVWESSTLTPIFDKDGNLTNLIIIDSDVTERKQNEEIIKLKNKDIMDSILYAKHIQEALLPPINELTNIFQESFMVFKPKDIVSGDFYWFSETDEVKLLALADCTGHGVPGAFMSVIGNEMLNISLHDPSVRAPSSALNLLDKKIKAVFSKGRLNNRAQDGMDIGLLILHANNLIQYSGARRPLILIRNGEKIEFSGDKFSIGGVDENSDKYFTDKELFVQKDDMLYLFSDGYADQFGGPKGKKIMQKNFTKFLCDICELSMAIQKEKLETFFENWRGDLEQVDDVSVVGIRIV